jgi:hypothetical protein
LIPNRKSLRLGTIAEEFHPRGAFRPLGGEVGYVLREARFSLKPHPETASLLPSFSSLSVIPLSVLFRRALSLFEKGDEGCRYYRGMTATMISRSAVLSVGSIIGSASYGGLRYPLPLVADEKSENSVQPVFRAITTFLIGETAEIGFLMRNRNVLRRRLSFCFRIA